MALQEARGLATTELHSIFGLRQRRPRAAATTEFTTLGITQRRAAKIFDVSERHFRRWRSGDRQIPIGVAILLRLVAMGRVSLADVERAAGLVINGRASPEPPLERAPVPAEAAAALTPVKITGDAEPRLPAPPVEPTPTPTRADPSLSTAQKVLALGAGCRWPHNDPRHPDFFFCDAAVTEPPYCPYHRRAAFMTRSSPETRPGFRLRGLAPPMKRPLVRCPAHAGEKQTDGSCF